MEYMSALQGELDEGKPSLFELLSEEQLAALLPPTVRYLLVLATQRYPRYLLRVLNSYDEVYAVLDVLVQRHFLRTYGGGFTENFYGMKRERVLAIKGGEAVRAASAAPGLMRSTLKLSERDVWKNLAVMVGLPYIKRRLDEAYEIHGAPAVQQLLGSSGHADRLPHDATWKQKFQFYYRWFLRNVYPSLNAAYYFAILSFQLAYLFDNTAYSSPFLWMIRTRIRRLGPADFLALEALSTPRPAGGKADKSAAARPGQSTSIFHPRNLTAAAVPRLLSSLRILLPTSIFALKFLEWWHASDFARQLSRKAAEGLELPPPIVAGVSEPTSEAAAAAAAAAAKSKGKNSDNNNSGGSPTQGSPRRSAMKQSSSVALANRPSTPPNGGGGGGGGGNANDSSSSGRGGMHTPSSPSSPVSSRGGISKKSFSAPIAASSGLPILTVPRPTAATSALCPICVKPVITPTAAQTGFVFCYTCIFKWIQGSHERQEAWMRGEGGEEGWGEDDDELERAARAASGLGSRAGDVGDGLSDDLAALTDRDKGLRSRVGRWDSGEGRCAVTGRRVLGGTEGLRRVMV